MIRREENLIQRRDQTYPDFIRALGGTAQARSSEPSATIKALRGIDFGMLDNSIDRLEKRLSTRIDSDRAWDYFTADTNSAVISRYTRIYIEGSQSSGQPAATAEMVSRSVGNSPLTEEQKVIVCKYHVGSCPRSFDFECSRS